jgi:phosphatidate phosphatase APP1
MTPTLTTTLQVKLMRCVLAVERALDRHLSSYLRGRPGWGPMVSPYVSYGTPDVVHVRARVLVGRVRDRRTRRRLPIPVGLPPFLSMEVPGETVTVEVAGRHVELTSGPEGYVEAVVEIPASTPGWHDVTFAISGRPDSAAVGKLLVVDPTTRLGVVSDIDDTILHTGLTRLLDAVRTTLFTPEHARAVVAGASEFYRALLAGARGPGPIFYVSTGAWNLHAALQRFLLRHSFPDGPLLMTDWGPSEGWLFREASAAFKTRAITELFGEHPHLTWVLVGDSGQDDPAAYAAVARAHPGRVHAIYIREVTPASPQRSSRIRRLATELATIGVPLLLVPDSAAAADHALAIGLIDEEARARVHSAVGLGQQVELSL